MMLLLRQFGTSMFIHQTPKNLQHITEPFSVADEANYVRRFHFDDPRGILAQHDPEKSRALKSRFMEMWEVSHQALSTTRLGL
jgi:intein-encoded DNA endonuclease-like protein